MAMILDDMSARYASDEMKKAGEKVPEFIVSSDSHVDEPPDLFAELPQTAVTNTVPLHVAELRRQMGEQYTLQGPLEQVQAVVGSHQTRDGFVKRRVLPLAQLAQRGHRHVDQR